MKVINYLTDSYLIFILYIVVKKLTFTCMKKAHLSLPTNNAKTAGRLYQVFKRSASISVLNSSFSYYYYHYYEDH